MKSQSTMECNTSQENGQNFSSGIGMSQEKQNCDDTEDDEDDDRNESTNITTSVADLCSASHEFEWLSPTSQGMSSYTHHHHGKQNECGIFGELSTEHQSSNCIEEQSPVRSSPQRSHKPAWPRRTADPLRMSPSPYNELHCCRRHLSPMRSSWCCPSPPPSHVLCAHHPGPIVSNMELVPYSHSCCGSDISYCSCLPPTGLPHSPRYHESHTWCHNTSPHHEVRRKESSSPCAMHRSCQGITGSRKSRSTTPRKRDSSPTPLSPRYSPVPVESGSIVRPSTNDQWQVAFHSEDINSLQKVQELESDKKNLILQASVLADQVDAQADKIAELERLLTQKKDNLIQLEHNLHQEVLARSAVENSKLELITELSNLRLRITAAERDRKDSDDKCRKLENEVFATKSRLIEMETEYAMLKGRIPRNVPHITSSDDSCDFKHLNYIANDEKDQKLDELRSSLTKYKKLQDIVLSTHNRKVADISSVDSHVFNSDSMSSSLNGCLTKHVKEVKDGNLNAGRYSTLPSTSSISKQFNNSMMPSVNSTNISYSSSTLLSTQKSNSEENIPSNNLSNNQSETSLNHTNSRVQQEVDSKKLDSSNTEKESYIKENPVAIEHADLKSPAKKNASGTGKSSGVSFGKGFFKLKSGKRSSSEPYLEKEDMSFVASQPFIIKSDKERNKGFFKIFSKWKKSGSQNIDRVDDFKRGGVRATAGPRLGWSKDLPHDPEIPFMQWNNDMIVEWMNKLGLSMYISDCKRWMCNGEILSKSSGYDFEKELCMKNPLHRKKLLLAVKSMNSTLHNVPPAINHLDFHWVVRWLDDVGLPQYKDIFSDARVDGRVLHCLTVDDLLFLKVTSQLHHISIRRGIQLLREKNFDPHCIIRRSTSDENNKSYNPELVALWSNHRVMEWLRTVDLSEYAPNLRGSGVHGALIVYEPKFNTNLFATLLNIPPTKTLLRRHLATHFKHIVGDELTHFKREQETETPLSPSVKVKAIRKPQFNLKKKRNKSDLENDDYVCPMEIPVMTENSKQSYDVDKLIVRRNSDPSPQEQRHLDIQEENSDSKESTSKEISLSIMFQGNNLNEVPSTIV